MGRYFLIWNRQTLEWLIQRRRKYAFKCLEGEPQNEKHGGNMVVTWWVMLLPNVQAMGDASKKKNCEWICGNLLGRIPILRRSFQEKISIQYKYIRSYLYTVHLCN